jgi:hypothetical protein
MSKLNEIVFKPIQMKEYVIAGKKVVLKSLTTKDNIELDINASDNLNSTKDILVLATKILSRSIVEIEGIKPDSEREIVDFLHNQEASIVLDMLTKYQELIQVTPEQIKA